MVRSSGNLLPSRSADKNSRDLKVTERLIVSTGKAFYHQYAQLKTALPISRMSIWALTVSSDWYSLIWQVRLHSQDWNHSVAAGDAPVRSWSVKTCSEEKFACRSARPPPVPLSFVLCPSAVRSSRCTVSALRAHNSQCASIQRHHSPHVPLSIVLCPSAVRSSRSFVSVLRVRHSQCASIRRRGIPSRWVSTSVACVLKERIFFASYEVLSLWREVSDVKISIFIVMVCYLLLTLASVGLRALHVRVEGAGGVSYTAGGAIAPTTFRFAPPTLSSVPPTCVRFDRFLTSKRTFSTAVSQSHRIRRLLHLNFCLLGFPSG